MNTNVSADQASLPCHYIPFSKNKRFIGRDKVLSSLKQKIFVEECQRVTIIGLGSISKMQVALRFAYQTKENKPELSIFWVLVLSKASFEQVYTEVVRKLPSYKDTVDEDLKDSVRQYLNSATTRLQLLIVDNTDDIDILFGKPRDSRINQYLPENEKGLVLFTIHSREVAVSAVGSDIVELYEIEEEEVISFLDKALFQRDLLYNKSVVTDLLKELMYLLIVIIQAIAYLNRNQIIVAKYLTLLYRTEQDITSLISREFQDSTHYKGSQNAVATTQLILFQQICKSDSTAANLLLFISCIEPKAILCSILPSLKLEEQRVYTIRTLCTYSFLVSLGDSKTVNMHSLVHLAIQIQVQKQGLVVQATEEATRHLAEIFLSNDYMNCTLQREYLLYTLRLL